MRLARRSFIALCACTPVLTSELSTSATSAPKLYILPLGSVPKKQLEFATKSLKAFYGHDIIVLPDVPLPKSAYYRPRRRYRAEKLLRFLEARRPKDAHRILGLTARDISTTKGKHKDWGVLGLATIDGVACVISSFRTRRGAKSKQHMRERLGKVCVHEIGHTFGLPHCPTDACLMRDARGTVKSIDKEFDLCGDRCRPKLLRAGIALSDAAAPWPKP